MLKGIGALIAACMSAVCLAQLPPGFTDTAHVTGLAAPIAMAFTTDGRLLIAQKGGVIRVARSGSLMATPFASLNVSTNSERGLLGLALDPEFDSGKPYVYVYYTTNASSLNPPATPKNRVSRLTADGDVAVPGSETILLDDIPSDQGNHNAGCLRFGKDGKLYVATGDGGVTPENSQNLGNLAGKILRINKDGSIPSDNPFFGNTTARKEIYCYGLRNPFRFSFRPGTNTLYIGDVGQSAWEEVNVGVPAGNFGWPTYEGPTNVSGFISPVFSYPHTDTLRGSITGGVFVVGKRFAPPYDGSYFYADYVRDTIRRLTFNASNQLTGSFDFSPATDVVDLAEGPDGDLYYASISTGSIRRIRYKTVLTGLSLSPASLVGGTGSTGTLTLDHPAPAAGALIFLSSNNSAVSVPASIRIPGGLTSGSFAVITSAVASTQAATITASRIGVTKTATLNLSPTPDAAFVSQSVPSTMSAGGSYAVSVTMRNTGPTVWSNSAGYRLLSFNPSGNKRWGFDRVYLPSGATISNGQSVTFSFTVKAPSTPGSYSFQWRMLLNGFKTFGEASQNVTVTVN